MLIARIENGNLSYKEIPNSEEIPKGWIEFRKTGQCPDWIGHSRNVCTRPIKYWIPVLYWGEDKIIEGRCGVHARIDKYGRNSNRIPVDKIERSE